MRASGSTKNFDWRAATVSIAERGSLALPACHYSYNKEGKVVSKSYLLAGIGVGLVAMALGYLFDHSEPLGSSKAASVQPDKKRHNAPDFALKDGDGKLVHLSDYRGKVVLLDFWATWCGPCKIEIPWFKEFQRKYQERGLVVLGVSMDDEGWEVVKPFVAREKMNYRVCIGNDQTAQLYGGIDALPTTFLIDREGKIAAVHVGLADRKEFENGIEQLLQTPTNVMFNRAVPALFAGAR
jgi:peroxiredoxin